MGFLTLMTFSTVSMQTTLVCITANRDYSKVHLEILSNKA